MKFQHLIFATGLMMAVGCDTPSNMSTGSTTNGSSTSNTTPMSTSSPMSNSSSATDVNSASAISSDNVSANSSTNVSANASSSFSVPANTQSAFQTRYPSATGVQWTQYNNANVPIEWDLTDWPAMDSKDYAVTYNMNNNRYNAWYDSDGNWVGTTYALSDYKTMPAAVSNVIASRYSGYTISSANTQYWKDRMGYEVELKNSTSKVKLLVDANGNILKQKTKPQ